MQELEGLVRLPVVVGEFGQTFSESRQDWTRLLVGVDRTRQTFYQSRLAWSNFLTVQMGYIKLSTRALTLVKSSVEAGGTDHILWKQLGMAAPSVGVAEIGQTFCEFRQDWSNFLWE